MFEGNASYLYVANVARGTDTLEEMANGSVAIVDAQGAVVSGDKTGTDVPYRLVQKLASGEKVFSPEFKFTEAGEIVGASFVAPQMQVAYLGYNGADGALDEEAGKNFTLNIEWKNSQFTYNNSPMLFSGTYTTLTTDQGELASGLVSSLHANIKRQPYEFVKIERVSDGTATNLTNDTTVVNGVPGVASVAHGLAAGDAVSLKGISYLVESVTDVDNFVLDTDYKGISETITAGADAASLASITAWGLKFSSQENPKFNAVTDEWILPRFDFTSGDFNVARKTAAVPGLEGSGYWKWVAYTEIYAGLLEKDTVISAMPPTDYRKETVASNEYDMVTVEFVGPTFTSPTTGITTSHSFRIQIAIEESLAGDGIAAIFGVSV